jgi:polyhydroxybutyrate depolymerase
MSGGMQRTYIVHIPPAYDGKRRLPLVLNFHGAGSNARQQAAYSQFPAKAGAEGFIVVSPDAVGTPPHWSIPTIDPVDDTAFITGLLDQLERELCIDPAQVFAAGISSGAGFSARLACALPGRIAAIGVVGAMVYPLRCDPAAGPVAVIAFHGTEDACVPYEGGMTLCGAGLPVQPVEESAGRWAEHNRCNPQPARARLSEHVSTIAYSECAGETAVVLYVVDGGGHTWPGAVPVARLGPTTDEVDATDEMWQFFAAQGGAPPVTPRVRVAGLSTALLPYRRP